MKKLEAYSNHTEEWVIVPACDTCNARRTVPVTVNLEDLEVEYCGNAPSRERPYPVPCPDYHMNLRTRVQQLLGLL